MRLSKVLLSLCIALTPRPGLGDWQYRSRPDLSPPRLNITIPRTSDVERGYIFVAPYSSSITASAADRPEQPYAYIFRDDGDLIWSSVGYFAGFNANFQPARYNQQDVVFAYEGTIDLLHGHAYGHVTLLDENYDVVQTVRGGDHKLLDLHEFRIINETTALVEYYDQIPYNLSAWTRAENQTWIVDAIVSELDIKTGRTLFEWRSLDHVDPSNSVLPLNGSATYGTSSFEAWDYFHVNSVDKDVAGHYLVSGRHVSAIYKLNGTTGDIIWQLGGKASNFKIPDNVTFAFQHDARFRGKSGDIEYISLFDNGAGSQGHQGNATHEVQPYSSGKLLALNTSSWTASLVKQVVHPDKVLAASQGNTQILPNGNIFVNWGQAGTITEFGADGTAIFNAYLDSGNLGAGVQNYRGFKGNWTGRSREVPAIVALSDPEGKNHVYVSWNGDTQTSVWRLYAVTDEKRTYVGEQNRISFETKFAINATQIEGGNNKYLAEALDSGGRVISRTGAVGLTKDVYNVARYQKQSAQGVLKAS